MHLRSFDVIADIPEAEATRSETDGGAAGVVMSLLPHHRCHVVTLSRCRNSICVEARRWHRKSA